MPHTATCHCGATRIEVDRLPEAATECNCTFCSKVGALWGYYAPAEVRVVKAEADAVYAPNTLNKHHFCQTCGCATFGLSPNWMEHYGEGKPLVEDSNMSINLRLLDDVGALAALPLEKLDGRNEW